MAQRGLLSDMSRSRPLQWSPEPSPRRRYFRGASALIGPLTQPNRCRGAAGLLLEFERPFHDLEKEQRLVLDVRLNDLFHARLVLVKAGRKRWRVEWLSCGRA
jgi:hypothetical protein